MYDQTTFSQLLYRRRFPEEKVAYRNALWKVFIEKFLSRHIHADDVLLDIGGGYCEFINNVNACKKYVIDENADIEKYAHKDVTVIHGSIYKPNQELIGIEGLSCIFISNFLEHLISIERNQVIDILMLCFSKLKTGGKLIIIQPNFKYCYKDYYDFIDHHIPLTHLSMKEALETLNFRLEVMYPRFLPYTTVGTNYPPHWLGIYLSLPILWKIFGKQMFIKAVKQ